MWQMPLKSEQINYDSNQHNENTLAYTAQCSQLIVLELQSTYTVSGLYFSATFQKKK